MLCSVRKMWAGGKVWRNQAQFPTSPRYATLNSNQQKSQTSIKWIQKRMCVEIWTWTESQTDNKAMQECEKYDRNLNFSAKHLLETKTQEPWDSFKAKAKSLTSGKETRNPHRDGLSGVFQPFLDIFGFSSWADDVYVVVYESCVSGIFLVFCDKKKKNSKYVMHVVYIGRDRPAIMDGKHDNVHEKNFVQRRKNIWPQREWDPWIVRVCNGQGEWYNAECNKSGKRQPILPKNMCDNA